MARTTLHEVLIPGTDPDIVARYESLAARAADASFGIIEEEYVVLDTETTGFSATHDSLIEVAAAIMRGPEIVGRFSTFVDPGHEIPPFISELTGITQDDVRGAPGAYEVLKELDGFVGQRRIIAHNAPFDRKFIAQNAPLGSLLGDEERWIDSLELARIALPRLKEHKLMTLSEIFSAPASTHRAIDDVEALCGIWRILLVGISDLPPGLANLIAGLFPQTVWPLRDVLTQVGGSWGDVRFSLEDARAARARSQKQRQKTDALELDGGILSLKPFDQTELEQAFSDQGLLATMYGAFEPRPEQLEMATQIAQALDTQTHRVIEAGTGVGKSMAYLLPLTWFAQRNQVTCGVATKTNALLDQLMYHELPRLDAALPQGVAYVALKGYEHYPCLRKLMNLTRDDRVFDNSDAPAMVGMLLSFVCQSAQGDLDPLALFVRELPRYEICASPDDCLRRKCRYYRHCLLHGARQAAKKADVVVTNHALLFRDMETDGQVLPPIRQWVVDEAHGMEAEARSQLSLKLEPRTLQQTLRGLAGGSGSLASMARQAMGLSGSGLLVGKVTVAQEEARALEVIAESFFSQIKDLCAIAEKSSYNQVRLWINEQVRESGLWGMLRSTGGGLSSRMEKLWQECRDIVSQSEQFEELEEVQSELSGFAAELKDALEALVLILDGTDPEYFYYAELDQRPEVLRDCLVAARLDVGEVLLERLYPEVMSLIYTSATLAAGTSFEYFARGSGLDRLGSDRWKSVQLDSSYDFENNMAVYLPTDMPAPTARGYHDALERLILEVHVALGGSTLTLFTNRRDMEQLYERLKGPLSQAGIDLRCQSRGFSAKRLRDEFCENESLSLFALRSFWEGFDAPGDTLRCVIIPKLPFGKPNDPLMLERGLREQNVWRRYSLPEAIIDMKQAAGRLIRSSTDKGFLVLADSRLLTKGYGKNFLEALPSQRRYALDTAGIAKMLRQGR